MISEDQIIINLSAKSEGFIGDDAAILPQLNDEQYAISKDLLIEDVHFRTSYFSPEDLAHKALHANLSDLAAMGVKPLYILCGISIPATLEGYANDFLKYLSKVCKKLKIILIGGDTTASKEKLFISITAIGKTQNHQIKYRSAAIKDNIICLAGNLGWAHLGFTALERSNNIDAKYIKSFLRPDAKTKEAIWLAAQSSITSMMDVSDGLYIDLKRLCKSSNCGAVIYLDNLVYDTQFKNACQILNLEPLKIMLEGGEDYGLIFTCNEESFNKLYDSFSKIFKYNLKVIGKITKKQSVLFYQNHKFKNLDILPFTHF
ncbi:MAG: thiamine-phosphate kinase [Alphaproteobacteria bacterium]